jgi:hypothetical protein
LPLWSSSGSGGSSLDLFEPPSVPVVVGVEAGGGVSSEPEPEPEPDEPEPESEDPDPDEPDPEWDPPSSLDVVLPPPEPE